MLLQVVIILKAMIEVAIFAFLGQGTLFILAGTKRDGNWVYGILKTLTSPVFKVARFLSPRFVLDRHMWLVAMFVLIVAWLLATIAKVSLVLRA